MSIAGALRDDFGPGAPLDENTLLTDYWLDFVSVREEARECSLPRQSADALSDQLQDIEQRIAALREDQNHILEMFKAHQTPGPEGVCPEKAVIEISSVLVQGSSPADQLDHSSLPQRELFLDR